jgi:Family of unknown function (DUF5989)
MSQKPAVQDERNFQALASEKRTGFLREVGRFAKQTRKWWLVPLIVVLLGIGLLIVLGGTAAAPFLYTLF